jgi:hypothetical protein
MNRLFCFLCIVGVSLAGGCSGSSEKKDDKSADK